MHVELSHAFMMRASEHGLPAKVVAELVLANFASRPRKIRVRDCPPPAISDEEIARLPSARQLSTAWRTRRP